jgi:hypothetical protein
MPLRVFGEGVKLSPATIPREWGAGAGGGTILVFGAVPLWALLTRSPSIPADCTTLHLLYLVFPLILAAWGRVQVRGRMGTESSRVVACAVWEYQDTQVCCSPAHCRNQPQ